MSEQPDAVAQARAELEAAMSWLTTDESHRVDALIAAVRGECAAKVRSEQMVDDLSFSLGWNAACDRAIEVGLMEKPLPPAIPPLNPRAKAMYVLAGMSARDALAAQREQTP